MSNSALNWIDESLADLERRGLRRHLLARGNHLCGATIEFDGKAFVNFSSNDYLGLASDGRLTSSVVKACNGSWGSGASPLVTGRSELHRKLEKEIAEFEDVEAALLFSSGYAANIGTVSALVGRGDVIFSDAKNHASIIDGCKLSGATIEIFAHRDVADLSAKLQRSKQSRRRLIVTDGLFSMDGDLAPLADLAELSERHEAMLMVDETHATGVFGAGGQGIAEYLGVKEGVHVRVGTLSKAIGSIGGFVAGSRNLVDWLANRARPYVFSTASPAAICAAGLAALEIVREEPHRRSTLLHRAAALRDRLKSRGHNLGDSESQIIPILIGEPERTMNVAAALREKGFFVPGIRPPSVPIGESLLRISLSYDHDEETLDRFVEVLGELI